MPRRKKQVVQTSQQKRQDGNRFQQIFEPFHFGESYTSLVLGIIVVIALGLFFVSFLRNKPTQSISSTKTQVSQSLQKTTVTSVAASPTVMVTVSAAPSAKVKETKKEGNTKLPTTYTVQQGDHLWGIAEKFYQSGYNWIDIAKANSLANPGVIIAGSKLNIPNVQPKLVTAGKGGVQISQPNAITGNTYTIVKGDNLWSIAVRAYGDGYRWVAIAKENKLTNPGLIHSGNVLKIPR